MDDISGAIIEQIKSSIKDAEFLAILVLNEHKKVGTQELPKWSDCQFRFERWYRTIRKIFKKIDFSGFDDFEEVMTGGVFDSQNYEPTGGMRFIFEGPMPSKE